MFSRTCCRMTLAVMLIAGVALTAGAQVFVVPDGAGAMDGSSWDNAFASIQEALDAAAAADTAVWVAEGTYIITETIFWPDGVEAYGGFPVDGDMDSRNPWEYETVLQAQDIGGEGVQEGSVIVADVLGSTGNRLDGFTITGASSDRGAVLICEDGETESTEMTIANCIFIDNVAGMGGAITADSDGIAHIENCYFINNTGVALGGAVLFRHRTGGSVINSVFVGNSSGDAWGAGGALFSDVGGIPVEYCTFYNNTATEGGDHGDYIIRGGGLEVSNIIVFGNSPSSYEPDLGNSVVDEDPLFVDAEGLDLRVQEGSPAIGMGTNPPATDIRWMPRPEENATVGAYEFAEPVPVPDVVGMSQEDAEQAIIDAGLVVGEITGVYVADVPEGDVVSQDPAADETLPPDSPVNLVVSLGPPATVPDVVGMSEADAVQAIEDADLVAQISIAYVHDVDEGDVISQDPAGGDTMDPGSTVQVVVSGGPPVTVPSFDNFYDVEQSPEDVQAALEAAGLTVVLVGGYSEEIPEGSVIGIMPVSGSEVPPGSTVEVIVSQGPPPPLPVSWLVLMIALLAVIVTVWGGRTLYHRAR